MVISKGNELGQSDSLWCLQEEPEYEEPPLPDRYQEDDAPPLPVRSADVDCDHDEEDYEELNEPPPPPVPGLCLLPLTCHTFYMQNPR